MTTCHNCGEKNYNQSLGSFRQKISQKFMPFFSALSDANGDFSAMSDANGDFYAKWLVGGVDAQNCKRNAHAFPILTLLLSELSVLSLNIMQLNLAFLWSYKLHADKWRNNSIFLNLSEWWNLKRFDIILSFISDWSTGQEKRELKYGSIAELWNSIR